MTDRDSTEFARLMTLLSQNYEKPVSGALAEIYFDGLKDFEIEQIGAAVKQAIKTKTFFPKVAELRQLIEGAVEDRAAQGWAAFLEAAADGGQASVKFADPAAARAMDAVFGGWIQACRLLSAGGTNERGNQVGGCTDEMLASYQKQFARQYVAALNSPRDVELYRPGLSEMSMREGGAAWSARMPVIEQPVIYIGSGKIQTLRLRFDVARGELTDMARATLDGGWAAVQALASLERNKLRWREAYKALPPADEEMATPQEVAEIKRTIGEFVSSKKAEVISIADRKAVSE